MPLKTIVKVDKITNLSDARYCAGMGVDMLAFTVIEGQEGYLPPNLYQEIRGWVAGPSVVASLYGLNSSAIVSSILEHYAPEYLELSVQELRHLPPAINRQLILNIYNMEDLSGASAWHEKIAYVQVKESDARLVNEIKFPALLEIQSVDSIQDLLDRFSVQGVSLSGSPELRPGFKDYGNLADVLEQLEID